MSLISKTFTFTAGATIIASEHNTNFDTLYSEINGNIDNANIKASAAIVDSKLAQITTAGKITGDAFTSLANIPSSAGLVPAINVQGGSGTNSTIKQITGLTTPLSETQGGTGQTTITQGDLLYGSASNVISKLAAGTSGRFLKTLGAGANPTWSNLSYKANSFTRDISLTDSSVSITGTGFQPTLVVFIGCIGNSKVASWGFDTASSQFCIFSGSDTNFSFYNTRSCNFRSGSSSNETNGAITSMDSDGFTILFTKTGSPTGTADLKYAAFG